MKRSIVGSAHDDSVTPKRNKTTFPSRCEYSGYSFQKDKVIVETVDAGSIDAPEFFDRFISKRKPCVLLQTTEGSTMKNSLKRLTPQDLVNAAGEELVQVEKRFSTDESFGQNRTKSRQVVMTMRQLVDKLNSSEGELFYLSTQQQPPSPPPDEDTAKGDQKVAAAAAAFQSPCAQLLEAKMIESTLSWASALKLESCNIWMGSSKSGSSSGLHHDYHDNFYMLLQGTKQFRLYSPDTAYSMSTYGTIERIHFNGLISYVGSETMADGSPAERTTGDSSVNADTDDDDDQESEEEVVLGKGFDYHSDEDEEELVDMDGPDDFDELVDNPSHDDDGDDSDEGEAANVGMNKRDQDSIHRPNNFSRVNLADMDPDQHPDFRDCKSCIVELKAGQILYLPAGWFHSVTSFNSGEPSNHIATAQSTASQVHLALNYWYHPPVTRA